MEVNAKNTTRMRANDLEDMACDNSTRSKACLAFGGAAMLGAQSAWLIILVFVEVKNGSELACNHQFDALTEKEMTTL